MTYPEACAIWAVGRVDYLAGRLVDRPIEREMVYRAEFVVRTGPWPKTTPRPAGHRPVGEPNDEDKEI